MMGTDREIADAFVELLKLTAHYTQLLIDWEKSHVFLDERLFGHIVNYQRAVAAELNALDGGRRHGFQSSQEWVDRLAFLRECREKNAVDKGQTT